MGVRGCVPQPTGHSLVTLFFLSVSVKDRSLHWILVRSQTHYPEHILVYGSREGSLLSYRGFWLFFRPTVRVFFCGGGPCTALSPRLRGGGLESQFGRGPRTLGQESDGLVLLVPWVQAGRVFLGYLAEGIDS